MIILLGYLPDKVTDYFKNGSKFGIKIRYSISGVQDDTGTRIRKAGKLFKKNFLLLYCDNYWPLKFKKMISFYKSKKVLASTTIYNNLSGDGEYGKENNVFINENGFVVCYDRTRKDPRLNGVDIGFFIFDKDVFTNLPKGNFSFEDVVLPQLIKKRQLAGILSYHKYYGLSTHERIPIIEDYFRPKKVVFLDRDGVINKRPPRAQYVTKWDEFAFLPKVKEALKLLAKKGYEMYIVSSQAGIARRVLTKAQVDRVNTRMKRELQKIGVRIKGIYICPHGWDEGCFCRKPNPGLFFQAAAEHHINLYESYCIGDDERDIIAGLKAGCKVFLVSSRKTLYHVAKQLP